jgi:hypothetical protein
MDRGNIFININKKSGCLLDSGFRKPHISMTEIYMGGIQMKAVEYIEKHFHNGLAPFNVFISNNFAAGCMMIIDGHHDAGVKMIRGTISLVNRLCNQEKRIDDESCVKSGFARISKTAEDSMVNFAKKYPAKAFHAVRPSNELLKIGPEKEIEAAD